MGILQCGYRRQDKKQHFQITRKLLSIDIRNNFLIVINFQQQNKMLQKLIDSNLLLKLFKAFEIYQRNYIFINVITVCV